MAGTFPLSTHAFDTFLQGPTSLCSLYKHQLSLIDQFDYMDLTYADDARCGHQIDHLLIEILSIPLRNVVEEERELANFVRVKATRRERGCVALVWRLQIQSITVLAFALLFSRGLVDLSGLRRDVDFKDLHWHTWNVQLALENFDFARLLQDPPEMVVCDSYMAPLTWLACMIVRGRCVDRLEPIIQVLEDIGVFGRINHEAFRLRWPVRQPLLKKPFAMDPHPAVQASKKQLGFYLPMGMADETMHAYAMSKVLEKCRDTWQTFLKYFQLDVRGRIANGRRIVPRNFETTLWIEGDGVIPGNGATSEPSFG